MNKQLTEALTFINNLMEQGHYFMLDYDLVSECEVDQSIQDQISIYCWLDKQHNWNLHYLTQMLACKNFPEIVGEEEHEHAIQVLATSFPQSFLIRIFQFNWLSELSHRYEEIKALTIEEIEEDNGVFNTDILCREFTPLDEYYFLNATPEEMRDYIVRVIESTQEPKESKLFVYANNKGFTYANKPNNKHKLVFTVQANSKGIEQFFTHLCEDRIAFHPDNDFNDYVGHNDKPTFTKAEAKVLNQYMDKCFDFCQANDIDIYSIAIKTLTNNQ